jgi:uncharacterized protein (UPF0276 family)
VELLEKLRRDMPLRLHGTSLSIGSTEPLDTDYLSSLRDLADRVEPAAISDHLAWCWYEGRPLDLLPLPYTEECLAHVVSRVCAVQDALGRRLLLENPASYLAFGGSTLDESEFLASLSAEADCGILLDVNNLYVSAHNNGFDPDAYLKALPVERVAQFHLAGHREGGALLLDTHEGPVPEPVWELYRKAVARFGPKPAILEWDVGVASLGEMVAECSRAAVAAVP